MEIPLPGPLPSSSPIPPPFGSLLCPHGTRIAEARLPEAAHTAAKTGFQPPGVVKLGRLGPWRSTPRSCIPSRPHFASPETKPGVVHRHSRPIHPKYTEPRAASVCFGFLLLVWPTVATTSRFPPFYPRQHPANFETLKRWGGRSPIGRDRRRHRASQETSDLAT